MADLAGVERALVAQVATALALGDGYRAGALVASTGAGLKVRAYRGWPTPDALDADILAGAAHVSVFSDPGMGRNTTRYQDAWHPGATVTPTLTVSVAGSVVTFGGAGGAGQVAGIQVGHGTTWTAYAYRLTAADTPATVAAAFAVKVLGSSAAGPVLTIATNAEVQARVVADQPAWMETRRQAQVIRVTTWCPSPAARDAVAGAVDNALARVRWLPLGDGTSARLIYRGTFVTDATGKDRIWRRDLRYEAEYPTTYVEARPECLFVPIHVALNGAQTIIIGPEAA
ncbi:conserved protein of unknown function (plasmid) [Rhodovastum atsumiense]|uniref:Uncharacterized protein n=1 Tax=Rhodovastum atsumiense TaxID=504468 RepID=A0A5M6IN24_9PROT|nr:hypothetical protein [Rhodovastum atsumiense]KAA5609656.1 hypothetical protein F1189_23115 [Rhodovastum atsumiense]CAH2606524.1 conserved protein of unknown function [Rhodovastum atsumiense]